MEKSQVPAWARGLRSSFPCGLERSERSGPARTRAHRSAQSPRAPASSSAASDSGAFLAATAAAAGLRALGAKGSGWLRLDPWAPLTTGFYSRGPARIRRPEPGPRPTIVRQRDGIRSAARLGAGLFRWGWPAGHRERGAQEAGCQPCHPTQSPERLRRWSAPPAAEPFIHRSPCVRRKCPT